jgi:exonuclease III
VLTVASVNVNGVRAAVRRGDARLAERARTGEAGTPRQAEKRIDYQIATPELAVRAVKAGIDRAPSYAERWSDHAPVVVCYDLDVRARS